MKKSIFFRLTTAYLLMSFSLSSCGQATPDVPYPSQNTQDSLSMEQSSTNTIPQEDFEEASSVPSTPLKDSVYRDNTPLCLIPTADGTSETHNNVAVIDYSNASSGYIMANYTGSCPKVKLRITGSDQIVYTYDLHGNGYETFPLSSGNGIYDITIYENISGTSYSTCLYEQINVSLQNEFTPFLYPNQYVNFTSESKTVAKAMELAANAQNDLDVVTNIYDYVISEIIYDYEKASDPPTGYTTDIDAILESGTGICLDYAAVMASMLRSQQIPTRLEVGYAQDAYHAWISVYLNEVGWMNGIIEFTGKTWTLVDPTFGANTDDKTLKKFIGDGSNYVLQKMY